MPKAPKKKRHLGPRKPGRTFNNDIMRGESAVPADGLGPGQRRRSNSADAAPVAALTYAGKQRRRPDLDPVTQKILGGKRGIAVPGGMRGGNSGKTGLHPRPQSQCRAGGRRRRQVARNARQAE
jgi:hypothetical protein